MGGTPTPFSNAFKNLPTGSFRYNTSQAGIVLPICYGTQRIPVNLLEFWDFSGGSGKGGKGGGGGGGGGGKKGGNATYSVYVAMAICQGPLPTAFTGLVGGTNDVWSNGGQAPGLGSTGLNGYTGADGQSPDPTFVSMDPNSPVIGYSGIVYVTGTPMQLGTSPALPNISFQITGFEVGTIGPDYPNDANPSNIVQDLLTNARYGAGFPSANIDSGGTLADFANYCQAAQLAMSLLMDRPQSAAQWVDEICRLTVAAPVMSGPLLKIIPYATGSFSANGATWTPNLTPLYSLDDDDIMSWEGEARGGTDSASSDPVIVTRNDPSSLTNWLSLEYYDSSNSYNPNITPAWDQGAIDAAGGPRTEPSTPAHEYTNITSATIAAQLMVNRKQAVRRTFKFQTVWRYLLLEPMDVVEITDGNAGLNAVPARVTSITETDNGELQIESEELAGVASGAPPVYPTSNSAGSPLDLFASPGSINTPVIFEPSTQLTNGDNEVWIAVSGGSNWGGCQVWISHDGTTYTQIGTITGNAKQGLLSANLASYGGSNPDTGDTLSVDLTESRGQLLSASSTDAANGVSLCYVDGELISYQTATLVTTNKYGLTTLYRGMFGSKISSHSTGAQFSYLGLTNGPGLFRESYAPSLIGQTVYFKFPSFNQFGNEIEDLSSVPDYSYILLGTGTAPTSINGSYSGSTTPNLVVQRYVFAAAVTFPAGLTGSHGAAGVAATGSTSYSIEKNGSVVGTMNFAASGTTATFAMSSATTFNAGDVLTMVAPASPDLTLANLAWSLLGS